MNKPTQEELTSNRRAAAIFGSVSILILIVALYAALEYFPDWIADGWE